MEVVLGAGRAQAVAPHLVHPDRQPPESLAPGYNPASGKKNAISANSSAEAMEVQSARS